MRRLHRFAAAGLLGATGALVGAGIAYADSPSVSFSGGCGLLGVGAHSQPSVAELSVPAMGSVRFINGMNTRADLVLPGGKRYAVDAGKSLEVPIASGPAEALMEPACGLGLLPTYRKTTIRVESTQSPPPGENQVRPQSSAPATPAPSAAGVNGRRTAPSGTSGAAQPPASTSPAPQAQANPPIAEQPAIGLASGSTAVEPIAAGEVPDRASSLLAMVATICVVGVAAAAGRAITSQRTSRAATA